MIEISKEAKALIFDCDGTLVDTMELHAKVWKKAFETVGKTCTIDFLFKYNGAPTNKIIEAFNKTYGYDINVDELTKLKEKLAFEQLIHSKPIQPVVDIVYKYKDKLPMAVVSGGTKPNVCRSLEAIGLLKYFDTIITANDPVKPKPSPDVFLEAAKRLNIKPENCQVFEDGELGIVAAHNAKMIVTDVRKFIEQPIIEL